MTKKTYAEKLLDPRWQKKRLEILSRDKFMCQMCGDTESTLHVHHIAYQGNNPWDTNSNLLITLCKDCHDLEGTNFKDLTTELIKVIKQRGIMSAGMHGLIEILTSEKDRGWTAYEPMYSIIAYMIDNDELWDHVSDKFWQNLREKNKDKKIVVDGDDIF